MWKLSVLPILPSTFQNFVNQSTQKQFNVIKNLFSKADDIICATDAGREGELIFRLIYQMCEIHTPFKRLWISSQTDDSISNGFKNLQPSKNFDNLYHSARCRKEADWIVGINATKVYTICYKQKLTLGRVQTPVLRMIVDREIERNNFKPEPFWELYLNVLFNNENFTLKYTEKLKSLDETNKIISQLNENTVVENFTSKKKS